MLEVQWEYLETNIGTDNGPVAILKKKTSNQIVLSVYEGRNAHYSIPSSSFSFIKSKRIPYLSERAIGSKYGKEKIDSLSCLDVLALRLKEGCKIIEEDFLEQAEKIIELIS